MTPNQIGNLQLVTPHQAALRGYIRSLTPGANADDIRQCCTSRFSGVSQDYVTVNFP